MWSISTSPFPTAPKEGMFNSSEKLIAILHSTPTQVCGEIDRFERENWDMIMISNF